MATFSPAQRAVMSVSASSGTDIGTVVPTGMTAQQPFVWQIYRADFFLDPAELYGFDHTVDWAVGFQLATSSVSDWLGWRAAGDASLIYQGGALHLGNGGLQEQALSQGFAWQWLPPVSFYTNRPYLELVARSEATNLPATVRANVYYKVKQLDLTTLALLRL
jgi:hypothetical protein